MYEIPKQGILASLNEVLCFAELLLRWKHEACQKIISEINKGNLTLYHIIKELDFDTDDPRIVITKAIFTTGNVKYFFSNIKLFVFLLAEVEAIEVNNITYKLSCDEEHIAYDFELCTLNNVHTVTPQVIYAMCKHTVVDILTGHAPQISSLQIRITMASDKIELDLCPPGNKKDWVIPKEQLFYLRLKSLTTKSIDDTSYNIQKIRSYIKYLQGFEDNDVMSLLKQVLARYPKLTDAKIGKLFPANKNSEENTHAGHQNRGKLLMRRLKESDPEFWIKFAPEAGRKL